MSVLRHYLFSAIRLYVVQLFGFAGSFVVCEGRAWGIKRSLYGGFRPVIVCCPVLIAKVPGKWAGIIRHRCIVKHLKNRNGVASPCRTTCTVCGDAPCYAFYLFNYIVVSNRNDTVLAGLAVLYLYCFPLAALFHSHWKRLYDRCFWARAQNFRGIFQSGRYLSKPFVYCAHRQGLAYWHHSGSSMLRMSAMGSVPNCSLRQ